MPRLGRTVGRWPLAAVAAAVVTAVAPADAAQQASPKLRAGVDLLTISVQITPTRKGPMPRLLTPADFVVKVRGQQRAIVSATLWHYDTGTVLRHPLDALRQGTPACGFGFHRKVDRTTAHYLLALERIDDDRKPFTKVQVTVIDKAFEVQRVAFKSPIRK
jgi:hypothetical protein